MNTQKGSLIERLERRFTPLWRAKSVRFSGPPVISFSFDDFPRSAWTEGRRILEDAKFLATYYVSSAFAAPRLDIERPFGLTEGIRYYQLGDLLALHQSYHEIGCHTHCHRRVTRLSSEELSDSLDQNQRFANDILGTVSLDSFAYPQGAVNVRSKRLCARRFQSCRGTIPGINSGWMDLGQLRAIPLNRKFQVDRDLVPWLERLKHQSGWLIFYGHEVEPDPSPWGCTPETLIAVVDAVARSGIPVKTVGCVTRNFSRS